MINSIPCLRHTYPDKHTEKHTLAGRTSPLSPYKGVPPPPRKITVYFQTLENVQLSDKQIFTVFIKQSIKCRKVNASIIESLSSSNFSISCWVDEANREAILTSLSVNLTLLSVNLTLLSVNLTLLLEIMHCAQNLQIIH